MQAFLNSIYSYSGRNKKNSKTFVYHLSQSWIHFTNRLEMFYWSRKLDWIWLSNPIASIFQISLILLGLTDFESNFVHTRGHLEVQYIYYTTSKRQCTVRNRGINQVNWLWHWLERINMKCHNEIYRVIRWVISGFFSNKNSMNVFAYVYECECANISLKCDSYMVNSMRHKKREVNILKLN